MTVRNEGDVPEFPDEVDFVEGSPPSQLKTVDLWSLEYCSEYETFAALENRVGT